MNSTAGGNERLHQYQEHNNSTRGRCRRPRPVYSRQTGKWEMKACGRPKCSRECRDKWGWKHALCAARSFRTEPPSHHLVIRPAHPITAAAFSRAIIAALRKLKSHLDGDLEYIRLFEWSGGRIHAHVWVRTAGVLRSRATKKLLAPALPAGAGLSCAKRRKCGEAVAKYLFKDLKKLAERAELPPPSFHGKLFVTSQGFFTKSIGKLWNEVRDERTARTSRRFSNRTAPDADSIF